MAKYKDRTVAVVGDVVYITLSHPIKPKPQSMQCDAAGKPVPRSRPRESGKSLPLWKLPPTPTWEDVTRAAVVVAVEGDRVRVRYNVECKGKTLEVNRWMEAAACDRVKGDVDAVV